METMKNFSKDSGPRVDNRAHNFLSMKHEG
jgi:hypothetical protein